MADELATITGTIYRNTASTADRVPWPGVMVRAVPVLLDETAAIADSVSYVPAVTDAAGLVTLRLWPGAWAIHLPDGEIIDGDGTGVTVEAGASYTLLGLRGYVAPPGTSVTTVELSSLTATTLAAGEDATVEVEGDGLVLGIPRGAPGAPGEPGREVELQTTATHVQWRYVGDATWTDLAALADLGSQTYASLDDVDLTGLADGDAMVWDATAERWVRVSLPSTYVATADFFDSSSNLFDRDAVTVGQRYLAATGELSSHGAQAVSDWIPITGGESYTYGGAALYRVTYFDADRAYVGYSNITTPATVAAPTGAAYARLSVVNATLADVQMNAGGTLLPFEIGGPPTIRAEHVALAVEPVDTNFFTLSTNLFDLDLVTDGYSYEGGTGALLEHSDYVISDWIPVTVQESYTYGGTVQRVTYFDVDRAYISDHAFGTWPVTRVAPPRTRWARLSVNKAYLSTAQMNAGTSLLSYRHGGYTVADPYLPVDQTVRGIMDSDISATFGANVTYPDMSTTIPESTTVAGVHALYDALVTAHPDYVTRTLIGNEGSADNLPLYLYDFNPPQPSSDTGGITGNIPKVIIFAGVHGGERAAIWTTYHFAENLCNSYGDDPLLAALRFNVRFLVVPICNPSGVRDNSRTNANGVDLARNWPAGWALGTPGDNTYGGPEPYSEPETVALNTVLSAHEDATLAVDFHNFSGNEGYYYFLWATAANVATANVLEALYRRMDRKWKADEPTIVDQDPSVFIGRLGLLPGGTFGKEADARGIPGALSYEHCYKVVNEPGAVAYSGLTMTWGYESWVNFILLALKNL